MLQHNNNDTVIRTMKKLFFFITLGLVLSCTGVFSQDKKIDGNVEILTPEPHHGEVAREIINALRFYHFKEVKIDDTLSSHVFDKVFESLDPVFVYFTQSDIKRFEPLRYSLDDMLKRGDLSFGFDAYNLWRERAINRILKAIELSEKEFDFTQDDYYVFNREKLGFPKDEVELDEIWEKRIKYEALNLKLAGKEEDKTSETLKKRYENFLNQVKKQKSEDVFQLYMNALTESIEPHTTYFSPRTAENFKISMSNSLEGIGATLRTEGEFTKVVEVVKGGPADKSNQVKANDRILAVGQGKDGELVDVLGWRIDEVVSLIRGAKGTVVRLQIQPASAAPSDPPRIVTLVRDKIKLEEQSAKGEVKKIKKDGQNFKIGVITIPSFYLDFQAMQRGEKDYKSTTADVKKIIEDLTKQNVDGIIVDLRDNGGGSLMEAVELTGLFIPNSPVVQVKDATGRTNVEKSHSPKVTYNGPLVVLVNRFSASASEIFAGAVQDFDRGIVVGEQTFGKGTVQNLIDISRLLPRVKEPLGQLKMTFAKFYRVTGSSTQHKGVIPDFIFPSLYSTEDYGESSEKFALPWDKIEATEFTPSGDLSDFRKTQQAPFEARLKENPDYRYLLDNIAEFQKRKNQTSVTLNLEKAKAEREADEARELQHINNKRIAKGLKPVADKSELEKEEQDFDLIYDESINIIVELLKQKKVSNHQ